jgi:hypothetical protein
VHDDTAACPADDDYVMEAPGTILDERDDRPARRKVGLYDRGIAAA